MLLFVIEIRTSRCISCSQQIEGIYLYIMISGDKKWRSREPREIPYGIPPEWFMAGSMG